MYKINNIYKSFDNLNVLAGISMDFPKDKIVSIIGPSGCGKTTLLNIITGILEPDSGKRGHINEEMISYLFQEPRLLEWKTVYENVEFVIKDKFEKKELKGTIKKYLEEVELIKYKDFYPYQLSGGMKQRTAIARAFAYPSQILIMDEPFKSLDIELKMNLIKRFINIWEKNKRTVIFVTHDIQSSILLGDYIYILSKKPTNIKLKIENPLKSEDRDIYNLRFIKLEREIYKQILE